MDRFPDISRRTLLAALASLAVGAGAGNAVYRSEFVPRVGYGTNLLNQDIDSKLDRRLRPRNFTVEVDGATVSSTASRVSVDVDGESHSVRHTDAEGAEEIDEDLALDGVSAEVVKGRSALEEGSYEFELHDLDGFFERSSETPTSPWTVELLRGEYDDVPPSEVEDLATDPTGSRDLVNSLMKLFRNETSYDLRRYAVGGVENTFPGVEGLRDRLQREVDFDAIAEGDVDLFCWEYTSRVGEAVHSVPAHRQTPPLAVVEVVDRHHGHVYNGLVSAVEADDGVVLPVTFVDYTFSTLYHSLSRTSESDERLNAFDARHRADEIYWNAYG